MNKLLACSFVLVVASGCFDGKDSAGPGDQDPTPSMSESMTQSGSDSRPDEVLLEAIPLDLILNNCTGWYAVRSYVGSTGPGARPEGWEAAPVTDILSGNSIEAYSCARLSLGRFERGPIHVMFETHSNADFPPACVAELPANTSPSVLVNLWVDDSEIGAFMQETYGLPIQVGSFEEAQTDAEVGTLHTWTWAVEGGEDSTITIPDDEQPVNQGDHVRRLFWQRESAVLQLEVDLDDLGPNVPPVGFGMFQPPMVMASDTAGIFADTVGWFPQREAAGTFAFYNDMRCEEPA